MDCILPEYRLSEEKYEELWKNCMFVLDTSVVLNIYRYSPELRQEVNKVLEKISSRLWIPYQVAFEYYDNLPIVISGEISKYDAIRKSISNIQKPIREELDKNLRRTHSSSSEILKILDNRYQEFEAKYDDEFKKLEESVEDIIKSYPKRSDLESINGFIISLFNGKVGKPYSIKELEEISDRGSKRYSLLLPPGYMDEKDNGKRV